MVDDMNTDGYKPDATDGDDDGRVQDATKHERYAGYKPNARDGDGDGLVQDGTAFEREKGTEMTLDEQKDAVDDKPKRKSTTKEKQPAKPVKAANHVVGGGDKDDIYLSAAVYKHPTQRKSLTVHHLQRRLAEYGYGEAMGDKDGWYADNTKVAVTNYQQANQLEATGIVDAATFEMLFAGDHNVRVNIDV